MADIKTELRELSAALGLSENQNFIREGLFNVNLFCSQCKLIIINNDNLSLTIEKIKKKIEFSGEEKTIINNGITLGAEIRKKLKIQNVQSIDWVGSIKEHNPIDLIVKSDLEEYKLSLKEDSFILENMGLYKLFYLLTGEEQPKGLHIFNDFAKNEFNLWFNFTWNCLVNYINTHRPWTMKNDKKNKFSQITLKKDDIEFFYKLDENEMRCLIPKKIKDYDEFDKITNSTTREQVFSKFISDQLKNNEQYIDYKNKCSKSAGENFCNQIRGKLNPIFIKKLLRIVKYEYIYAKISNNKIEIYQVPNLNQVNDDLHITLDYSVPKSQLNINTKITNNLSGKTLELRNELRYSHGQFNGVPEAKLYIAKDSCLNVIYTIL